MKKQNDTRNNWLTMMFVCKYRYNCLRKQSVINDCELAFREFEKMVLNLDLLVLLVIMSISE